MVVGFGWWVDGGGVSTIFRSPGQNVSRVTPEAVYSAPPSSSGGASASKAKPWKAQLHFTEDGKRRGIHIATFAREQDAARAFDRVSIAKLRHAEANLSGSTRGCWSRTRSRAGSWRTGSMRGVRRYHKAL